MDRAAVTGAEDEFFVLSTLPPSRSHKRLVSAVALALLVTFLIAAGPLSRAQTTRVAAFVPAYTAAIFISEMLTAVFLFGQFSILRTRALLVISNGYLFTALMAVAWMLMFPGVFVPDVLIGGIQSRAYIYLFWHAGFPVFVIAYALLKNAGPRDRYYPSNVRLAIASSVSLTVGAVLALALFVAAEQALLPRVELDPLRFSSLWLFFAVPMASLILVAALVLWSRRRSVLDLWLIVVMCAYEMEIWLSYFPLAIAYGFGWYASRLFGLFSSSLVLVVLLYETTTLYARLLEAVNGQRREREARLMTGDAVAATIAQELKEPLCGMIANADAGLRVLCRSSPNLAEAQGAFRQIAADGHRAGEVIEGVRKIFRKDDRHTASVDLNDLIGETLALKREDMERRRISVKTDLGEKLPQIAGHRIQLQQVLVNLFTIAIESMSATNKPRLLSVRSEIHDGGFILVSIADTGIGIEAQDIDRIFDPLFTTKADGFGMGLSICRSIIEAHGGRLRVAANSRGGTASQFGLPARSVSPGAGLGGMLAAMPLPTD